MYRKLIRFFGPKVGIPEYPEKVKRLIDESKKISHFGSYKSEDGTTKGELYLYETKYGGGNFIGGTVTRFGETTPVVYSDIENTRHVDTGSGLGESNPQLESMVYSYLRKKDPSKRSRVLKAMSEALMMRAYQELKEDPDGECAKNDSRLMRNIAKLIAKDAIKSGEVFEDLIGELDTMARGFIPRAIYVFYRHDLPDGGEMFIVGY